MSTGLYYLQSRYYSPEWGRFLNCDDTAILLATQGETHGANLFAYCGNNPVNRADFSGRAFESVSEAVFKSYMDLIQIIINDWFEGNNPDNNFITIHRMWINARKTNLYNLQISFVNDSDSHIYDTVKTCFLKNSFLTCFIITFLARIRFQEVTGRQFLFSADCMYTEINYHITAYIVRFKRSRANPIDIAESDVYVDKLDNKLFNYNSGISNCYKWTEADPYRVTGIIGGVPCFTRSSSSYIEKTNTDWERWLYHYGHDR